MTRACVVGAGPSGLVATKTLAGEGIDVDCLETSSVIGGQWAYDNPNGRSAVYRSIHTNTTLAMSRLSDFEMPGEWAPFPTHEQVQRWFESYVDAFAIRDRITLGVEVVAARPLEPGGWRVELRDTASGDTREETYDALLACTGSYWAAKRPEVPGTFAGEAFHAQRYRDPQTPVALAGRRVVVVGTGNTGCEIACELAEAGAKSVSLSARSGTWILPKLVDGRPAADGAPMMHPCDEVPAPLAMLPRRAREAAFAKLGAAMMKRRFGERMRRFEALGLPPPPDDPNAKRATVCEPLLEALERGAVQARPAIERFDGERVTFADGRVEEADVVIYATGFHLRYPYLPADLADTSHDDLRLFMGTMHPQRHDLFVLGVGRPTGSFWPIAELHAQLAAALLSGRYRLPPQRAIERLTRPILGGKSFNPALFGLAMREEIARGEKRAR